MIEVFVIIRGMQDKFLLPHHVFKHPVNSGISNRQFVLQRRNEIRYSFHNQKGPAVRSNWDQVYTRSGARLWGFSGDLALVGK